MNVGSSFTHEYHSQQDDNEYEVDEDGEGLVGPSRGRAANYTAEEDKLLCNTWCNVGMDPAVGTDQNRDTYWVRMKEYFDARNKSGIERTERSLRSRWSLISTDCQKWSGVLAAIDKINPSGTNYRDWVSCTLLFFLFILHVPMLLNLLFSMTYLFSLFVNVAQHCPKFIQGRTKEGKDGQDGAREAIHIGPLLQGARE